MKNKQKLFLYMLFASMYLTACGAKDDVAATKISEKQAAADISSEELDGAEELEGTEELDGTEGSEGEEESGVVENSYDGPMEVTATYEMRNPNYSSKDYMLFQCGNQIFKIYIGENGLDNLEMWNTLFRSKTFTLREYQKDYIDIDVEGLYRADIRTDYHVTDAYTITDIGNGWSLSDFEKVDDIVNDGYFEARKLYYHYNEDDGFEVTITKYKDDEKTLDEQSQIFLDSFEVYSEEVVDSLTEYAFAEDLICTHVAKYGVTIPDYSYFKEYSESEDGLIAIYDDEKFIIDVVNTSILTVDYENDGKHAYCGNVGPFRVFVETTYGGGSLVFLNDGVEVMEIYNSNFYDIESPQEKLKLAAKYLFTQY